MERRYTLYSKTETAQMIGTVQCNFMPIGDNTGMALNFNVPKAEAVALDVGDTYVMTMTKETSGEALNGAVDTSPIMLEG